MAKKKGPYQSKPGPQPISEEDRRLLFTISLANKPENGNLLTRFRRAAESQQGGTLSREQLIQRAKSLVYAAIQIYCESVEHEQEAISGNL